MCFGKQQDLEKKTPNPCQKKAAPSPRLKTIEFYTTEEHGQTSSDEDEEDQIGETDDSKTLTHIMTGLQAFCPNLKFIKIPQFKIDRSEVLEMLKDIGYHNIQKQIFFKDETETSIFQVRK